MEAFSPPGVAEREESHHELVKTILKNMKVNGKDYPIKIMEHEIHVWNHQLENWFTYE